MTPQQHLPRYQLVAAATASVEKPDLDEEQRRVVAHNRGPLLVLGGPGTGKTTVVVESVVARLTEDGCSEESVLILTSSRKAAMKLRQRISTRLARTSSAVTATTFHSFCSNLLRSHLRENQSDKSTEQLRLLTAAEQDFRIREILDFQGVEQWPPSLQLAVKTQEFASQLRTVLTRARQLGMEPDDLVNIGSEKQLPEWVSVGNFFESYLRSLDFENTIDYSELLHRCRLLLATPRVGDRIRNKYACVYVDEYQDCDAAQIGLLKQLIADGTMLVAVGDPDQAIYKFRGASPRAIADFKQNFSVGGFVEMIVLGTSYRLGPRIGQVAARLADRLPVVGNLDQNKIVMLRQPCASGAEGTVQVYHYDSSGAQAEWVAQQIRDFHLNQGVAWDSIAVLVRSGRRSLAEVGRTLLAYGIPIEMAKDDIPLAGELAVRPLHLALSVVSSGHLDATQAHRLLISPLGGLDPLGVRRLGRILRSCHRKNLTTDALPQTAAELIVDALQCPARLHERECPQTTEVKACLKLATLLAKVRDRVSKGATPEEALWALWHGTSWPQQLQDQIIEDGDTANQAHRDLDAICALFDLAARKELLRNRSIQDLLAEIDNQQIPTEPYHDHDSQRQAVRLLTAHRAKGLQWDVVFVIDVLEGRWPDLRRRGKLLAADQLFADGMTEPEPVSALLAEERRLFYLACTRASRHLIVSAVVGSDDQAEQPSRFIAELGVDIEELTGRPPRSLTLPGVVAELRRTCIDPDVSPELKTAAVQRLSLLANALDSQGKNLVPGAHPSRWWGVKEVTTEPEFDPDQLSVRLSGSSLASLLLCPRQWFLERQVRAEQPKTSSATLGDVIHVLADHATKYDWDLDQITTHLAQVWDQIPYEAAWFSASERIVAEAALERFLVWQQANPRQLIDTEVSFEVALDVAGISVKLVGKVDRLELDEEGRLHIVDLKTGRHPLSQHDIATMEQLGVYQLAATLGGFESVSPIREVGGAEAIYLRVAQSNMLFPTVRRQASLDDVPDAGQDCAATAATWVHDRLHQACEILRADDYPAQRCSSCAYCNFVKSCPAQSAGIQVVS